MYVVQATAKEYGTTYGREEEGEEEENDIRLETAADREALRSSSEAFYNDNIPAPQVSLHWRSGTCTLHHDIACPIIWDYGFLCK